MDCNVDHLKDKFFELVLHDIDAAWRTVAQIFSCADEFADEMARALAYRCKGFYLMNAKGEYQKAFESYKKSIDICRNEGDELGEALAYLSGIWAVVHVAGYDEAFRVGRWASKILQLHGKKKEHAGIQINLGLIHMRKGDYPAALDVFNEAAALVESAGLDAHAYLPNLENNRSLVLCYLGRYEEAVEVGENAEKMAKQLGQDLVYARIQHTVAMTLHLLGRYTEAHQRNDQARRLHMRHGQTHEAALCDLSSTDYFLEQRQFRKVQEKAQIALPLFLAKEMKLEAGECLRNQGLAYFAMNQIEDARVTLESAQKLFQSMDHWPRLRITELELALILQEEGLHKHSLEMATATIPEFLALNMQYEATQARLVSAQIAIDQQKFDRAGPLLDEAISNAAQLSYPYMLYQGYRLSGNLAEIKGDNQSALAWYQRALEELDNLQSRLITEFRTDFLGDKEAVTQSAVRLTLAAGQTQKAFDLVERAKSRALLQLVSRQPDLSIRARHEADEGLVASINQKRGILIQLNRQLTASQRVHLNLDGAVVNDTFQQARAAELEIEELWHQLLVQNAEYTREATLWEINKEPVLPHLDSDTVLLEFFPLADKWIVFLVSNQSDQISISTVELPRTRRAVRQLLRKWGLNRRTVTQTEPKKIAGKIPNAQMVLHQIYQALLGPVEEQLHDFSKVIVVPHGELHYLPFHALFDGEKYLLEKFQVSYLPGASFLNVGQQTHNEQRKMLAFGHSDFGRLPHAPTEAMRIAKLWEETPLLEEQARGSDMVEMMSHSQMLHFACHGVFRADRPLFSGLQLADGWLTTLDIFNFRLSASLVTLSACQTGRNVAGGGDELQGLMRAFLTAGAATLVMTLWDVADAATSTLR